MKEVIKNQIDEHIEQILHMKMFIDSDVKQIQKIFKDESLDLEFRWQLFMDVSERDVLPTFNFHKSFCHILDCSPDDFYLERYDTAKYADIYLDVIEDNDEYPPEKVAQWKREVLYFGHGAFKFDW